MTVKTKSSFTPGPWQDDNTRKVFDKHVIRHNGIICAVISDRSQDSKANARLIAASPTLYEFALSETQRGNVLAKKMLDSLGLS